MKAIRDLLVEARAVLETWNDVVPAVSLCHDIDTALARSTAPEADCPPRATAAAIVIDHRADEAAHLVPIVVIDYYREPAE